MSELSDYKRIVSDPLEKKLRATISNLASRQSELEGIIGELVEAMQNLMGHADTPVGRRKLGINLERDQWLIDAREALTRAQKMLEG